MPDTRNGLYYESMDIRNHVLSRNIGQYRGYKWSLLANGGLAIGMPYAVETELVPYTLSEKSQEGLHLDTIVTKGSNPMINMAWKEGGLFGYTHEVLNDDLDWISRNRNLLRSYFDYDSTEENNARLTMFPDSLPWGDSLREYSSKDEQQNTQHFSVYPDYIHSMRIGEGLSFDKQLGEEYLGRLFNMGFDYENQATNVGEFVDDYAREITYDIDELEGQADTRLGYIGRKMLNEAKWKQIDANHWELGYQKYADIQDRNLSSVESDIDFEGKRRSTYDGVEINHSLNLDYESSEPEFLNWTTRTYSEYDERDEENGNVRNRFDGTRYGNDNVSGIEVTGQHDLLSKTAELFRQHKIKTLVGRFHTSVDDPGSHDVSLIQSAVDLTKGMSHGRNLFKLIPDSPNDYDNPYCRVWTYHHQYSRMLDLIRPFSDDGKFMNFDNLQANYPGRPILSDPGRGSWSEKSVLNKNGMVNIAPTRKIGDDRVRTKQCMLSIENLAWKNVHKGDDGHAILDEGEIGPLGGRIMWFPPYNLQFNESVNVSWGSNDFIGRGEKIYSYTNTERTGTLSFTIIEDHPSIVDYWLNSDGRYGKEGSEEDEQRLLRFFAGCENLEVGKRILGLNDNPWDKKGDGEPNDANNDPRNGQDNTSSNPNDNDNESLSTVPREEFTKDNSISFYVYFPNNLSCIDFVKNPKVGVNYLVRGTNGFVFNPRITGDDTWTVDSKGEGTQVLDADLAIIGDWAKDIEITTSGPGYEMQQGHGLTDAETTAEVIKHNKNRVNDDGRNYKWGYGVDTDKRKERLCGPYGVKGDKTYKIYPENYCDSTNHHLNSTPNELDDTCKYSFMDVAAALTTDYKYAGKGYGDDSGRVEEIKKILGLAGGTTDNASGGRKYYFAIAGGASVHGFVDRNTGLSQRRANFLRSWLEDCFRKLNLAIDYTENAKIKTVTGIEGGEDNTDVNSLSAKRGRYAKAVIYWNDEDVKDATKENTIYDESKPESQAPYTTKEKVFKPDEEVNTEEIGASTTLEESDSLIQQIRSRYRDEELFFSLLREENPVVYKNIVDKVKYFDPAFHSITPEGFNARLSFLHQCTRQGPTMASSDFRNGEGVGGAGYAGNLSFGRAPVCVLRLGDFFNTRIIINSLSIQYETMQWDLNPEGIGVQPMLANVTLSFVFQGGSSLGGPIQRLQNAVSFNYYANQEVYDDRADVAVYGADGELDKDKSLIWMPGYGSMNIGQVADITRSKTPPYDVINESMNTSDAESTASKKKNEGEVAKEQIENI